MDRDEGIRTLFGWFGNKQFRIRDIDDDRLLTLTDLMGLSSRFINGQRTQLGRILSEMNAHQFPVAPNRIGRLVVVEPADGSVPGIYQVEDNLP